MRTVRFGDRRFLIRMMGAIVACPWAFFNMRPDWTAGQGARSLIIFRAVRFCLERAGLETKIALGEAAKTPRQSQPLVGLMVKRN